MLVVLKITIRLSPLVFRLQPQLSQAGFRRVAQTALCRCRKTTVRPTENRPLIGPAGSGTMPYPCCFMTYESASREQSMVAPAGPPATTSCEPRQTRKGAAAATDSGAGVWRAGVATIPPHIGSLEFSANAPVSGIVGPDVFLHVESVI